MIQYLAYIGPKGLKRIELSSSMGVDFPRGQTVDIIAAGMTPKQGKDLLRSGVFELRGAPVRVSKPPEPPPPEPPPPMKPPRHICGCGFVAKSAPGLKTHQRRRGCS